MSDKKKEKNDLTGPEIPLALTLVSGAAWYKYGHSLQVWFHQNLITIILGAACIFYASWIPDYSKNKKEK